MTQEEYERSIVTISKDKLASLPAAQFSGEIVVIDEENKVAEAISQLRTSPIIGFDTETRPSFKRGQSYKVALIQLATPECCYLFRTNLIGIPQQVKDLLEDPSLQKVGLSIHDDFHALAKLGNLKPESFIDLQQYVKKFKIADNSLSRLYGILFGERISKGQRLTNWEAPALSEAQMAYAALDAFACLRIYQYLNQEGFNPADSPYLVIPEPINEEEKEL